MRPANEAVRLETLHQYNVLDTPAEQVFDDIRLLAAHICETPIALISFVDADRVWFKSWMGLLGSEVAREQAFCGHTILQTDPLVIPDAWADARFATNPMVIADPWIRFYAGVCLRTPNGSAVGTLCVFDHVPRALRPEQLVALLALSRQVVALLELRRKLANSTRAISRHIKRDYVSEAFRESEERFQQLAENIPEVFWFGIPDQHGTLYISPNYEKVWGRSLESLQNSPRSWLEAIHPEDRERVREAVETRQTRGDYDEEYRVLWPDGTLRWIHDRAFPIRNDAGETYRIVGVAADITAHKLAERRLAAQYAIARVLAEATTLIAVTPQLLQTICEILDCSLGALWYINRVKDELHCVEIWHQPSLAADELVEVSRQARYRPNTGFPGHVWAAGTAIWVADIATDNRFPRAPIAARAGLHAAIAFPIRLGSEILGVMEFFSREIRQPDDHLLGMMSTIGSQIGQFAVRKRAEEGLQKAHAELEERVLQRTAELANAYQELQTEIAEHKQSEAARVHLLHRLVNAYEEERGRIARELHDNMAQYLTALILGLDALKKVAQGQPVLCAHLTRVMGITDELVREVHRLAWELRPAALNDLGLHTALNNYLTQWSERFKMAADFQSIGLTEQRLPSEVETTIYRITQEALTNVLKHARAQRVSVIIKCRQDYVQVIVEDDGQGFDAERVLRELDTRGSLGLVGMQERAALVSGTLEIESTPGMGTTIFLRIPIS